MSHLKLVVPSKMGATKRVHEFLQEFTSEVEEREVIAVAICTITKDGSMGTVYLHPEGANCTPALIGAAEYLKHRLLTEILETT